MFVGSCKCLCKYNLQQLFADSLIYLTGTPAAFSCLWSPPSSMLTFERYALSFLLKEVKDKIGSISREVKLHLYLLWVLFSLGKPEDIEITGDLPVSSSSQGRPFRSGPGWPFGGPCTAPLLSKATAYGLLSSTSFRGVNLFQGNRCEIPGS